MAQTSTDRAAAREASRVQGRRLNGVVKELIVDRSPVIIAGPWTGEVGFEVLYWIPLLRWCVERWPKLQDRLVVVSRGGVAGWYEGIADTYVDLGELYDAEAFASRMKQEREWRRARGLSEAKQLEVSDWDRQIAKEVGKRLGVRRPPMLHPSVAHASKKVVWLLAESDGFAPWRRPERGPLEPHLPDEYVAVRFYWNAFFQSEGRQFAQDATRVLSERTSVVLLDPGMQLDRDHAEFPAGGEVFQLARHVKTFADNLAFQSIAIANARAFVGSAGGLSYIAPHYGVPSVCFWSVREESRSKGVWRDLELAERVFSGSPWGAYTARSCHGGRVEEILAPVL